METPFWLTIEEEPLKRMWEAGEHIDDIVKAIPTRTRDAIKRHASYIGLKRPDGPVVIRPHTNWDRVAATLNGSEGMTAAEIAHACGVVRSNVCTLLQDRHGTETYVADWLITTRRPAAIWALGNLPDAPYPKLKYPKRRPKKIDPFAVAAGNVRAPQGERGRVYVQPMTVHDDELEAA